LTTIFTDDTHVVDLEIMKSAFRLSSGFTLIELLIVIALLGALAVGLLATIDPFEQLKRGRDTALRNTVSEFYNANLRYYSSKAAFPWTGTFNAQDANSMATEIAALEAAGELKKGFASLAGTGNLFKVKVTSTAAEHMAVCFQPESKAFQIDNNTKYDSSGGTSTMASCKSATTPGIDCSFCIE
jgi:prepilin-type N-terminal cleavage/methylation domain-containing protein